MTGQWLFFVVNCAAAWRLSALANTIDGLTSMLFPFSLLCTDDTIALCILQGPILSSVLLAPPWLVAAFVTARVLRLLGMPCANAGTVARAFVLGFVICDIALGAAVAFRGPFSVGYCGHELLRIATALASATMGLLAVLIDRSQMDRSEVDE